MQDGLQLFNHVQIFSVPPDGATVEYECLVVMVSRMTCVCC